MPCPGGLVYSLPHSQLSIFVQHSQTPFLASLHHLIQFPVSPPPQKESYAIRPLSCFLNSITKHLEEHSAPRPCASQQPLHKLHSSDLSQLFTDKGSLLRLITFPEASTFSVALKHTMASTSCWLSCILLSSLSPSS